MSTRINKSDLIERLAINTHTSFDEAERFLNHLQQTIIAYLQKGQEVNWHGFGKFSVTKRKGRTGINPRTLERMEIKGTNTPKFTAGERFRTSLNATKLWAINQSQSMND